MWTKDAFIHARLTSLKKRHCQHQHSLNEPNIKNCPGGLRDIHEIYWLLTHYPVNPFNLTELNQLQHSANYLQSLRLHLQHESRRNENFLRKHYQLYAELQKFHTHAEYVTMAINTVILSDSLTTISTQV